MHCVRKRSFHKARLRSERDYFAATFPVWNMDTVPAVETLEKFARALEVPMYQLFYDGEYPPELPNLPKRKGDTEWGSKGKDARLLANFCRLFSRIEEDEMGIVLFMAQKMARRKAV